MNKRMMAIPRESFKTSESFKFDLVVSEKRQRGDQLALTAFLGVATSEYSMATWKADGMTIAATEIPNKLMLSWAARIP